MRRNVPVADYLAGVRRELQLNLAGAPRFALRSVYMGGGTPSRLGPDGVQGLVAVVGEFFDIADGAEVTLEANPDDVTVNVARRWADSGINRVSLGIQSFDDSVLAWMHRTHDAAQARAAFSALRAARIDNISVDLIFALPQEIDRSWKADLEAALLLHPDHISLYGLTIERATPLARWEQRGSVAAATEESYAADFLLADEMASAAGFTHYEVSNFALPGRESRHNSAYWTGAEYLGIGPSAHSYDGECRSWNVAPYAEWLARLSDGRGVVEGTERLDRANVRAERVYLGLRTKTGFTASAADLAHAKRWSDAGWAEITGSTIRLTPEGWLRLDSLAAGLTGL